MAKTALIKQADAANAVFAKNLVKVMRELESGVLQIIMRSASAGGADAFDAAVLLNSRPAMLKALQDAGFYDLANEHVALYGDTPALAKKAFNARLLPPPQFTTVSAETFAGLAKLDLQTFSAIGEKAVDDLRLGLYRQAVSGMPLEELTKTLKASTVGVSKKGSPLSNYSKTHANTAILNFQGEVLREAGESIGAEFWEVVGPDDDVTRDVCDDALSNPVRTQKDWIAAGYWGGTPGGWNCRHQLFPYFGEVQVKDEPKPPMPEQSKKKTAADAALFIPSKTIKEAEEYAVTSGLAKQANYKGISLEAANEMNKSVQDTVNLFPALRGRLGYIGSAQERDKLIYEYNLKIRVATLRDFDPDSTHAELLKKAKRTVSRGRMSSGTWALSTSGNITGIYKDLNGIAYNANYFSPSKIEATKKSIASAVEAKFHPLGADTIKAIVDHEMAHQIDALTGIRTKQSVFNVYRNAGAKEIKEGLSKYAATNPAEFVAEGWSEYKNNPKPRKFATLIGKEIEEAARIQ